MPGRKFYASSLYRYGFNGKENDNETKGEGNQQDYGLRIYDPRLGRFLSVDPLTDDYPWYTPYQFAGNDVIRNIDLDGGEPKPKTTEKDREGQSQTTKEEPRTGYHGLYSTTEQKSQTWIFHEGGVNGSKEGWMTQEDYFSDILKPLAKEYNKGNINPAWDFATSRKSYTEALQAHSNSFNVAMAYDNMIGGTAKYIKENPTYDSWARYIPIWGSFKQALLDYSVGKNWSGTKNLFFAATDVFLVKSLIQTPLKIAAKAGVTVVGEVEVEEVAVHGNSLLSTKPTWGYKLFSQDGTFLKNGITSAVKAESRYSKTFMSTKYMEKFPFPNRAAAYEWEFQQNQILRGPLNLNMH